jgi:hypothetical protein
MIHSGTKLNLPSSRVYCSVYTVELVVEIYIFLRHAASVYFGITVRDHLRGCAPNG